MKPGLTPLSVAIMVLVAPSAIQSEWNRKTFGIRMQLVSGRYFEPLAAGQAGIAGL